MLCIYRPGFYLHPPRALLPLALARPRAKQGLTVSPVQRAAAAFTVSLRAACCLNFPQSPCRENHTVNLLRLFQFNFVQL